MYVFIKGTILLGALRIDPRHESATNKEQKKKTEKIYLKKKINIDSWK